MTERLGTQNNQVVRMGHVQHGASAFIQHIGIKPFGAHERNIAFDPFSDKFEAFKLAFKRRNPGFKTRSGLKPSVPLHQMVGEVDDEGDTQDQSGDAKPHSC